MAEISDAMLEQVTGKSWATWLEILKSMKAEALPHKEIAHELVETYGVDGWWAQHLTVKFEREIGRREVGQVADGSFQTSVSKTLPGTSDDVMAWWREKVKGVGEFSGVSVLEVGETSTKKWRHWRAKLADGSRLMASSWQKAPGKAGITVSHEKLDSPEAMAVWNAFWKGFLESENER